MKLSASLAIVGLPLTFAQTTLYSQDFEGTDTGFEFVTNIFHGTSFAQADGDYSNMQGKLEADKWGKGTWGEAGGIRVRLCATSDNQELSAGYEATFELEHAVNDASVSFHYQYTMWSVLDEGQSIEIMVGVDDTHEAYVEMIDSTSDMATDWAHASAHVGHLAKGKRSGFLVLL